MINCQSNCHSQKVWTHNLNSTACCFNRNHHQRPSSQNPPRHQNLSSSKDSRQRRTPLSIRKLTSSHRTAWARRTTRCYQFSPRRRLYRQTIIQTRTTFKPHRDFDSQTSNSKHQWNITKPKVQKCQTKGCYQKIMTSLTNSNQLWITN